MALAMVDQHESDNEFPQVRVGMAYGHVLSRLGDVYGPVVNVASRLTSIAKRGRIVIDRALADSLGEQDWLRIRRMRRTSVKGYEQNGRATGRGGKKQAEDTTTRKSEIKIQQVANQ